MYLECGQPNYFRNFALALCLGHRKVLCRLPEEKSKHQFKHKTMDLRSAHLQNMPSHGNKHWEQLIWLAILPVRTYVYIARVTKNQSLDNPEIWGKTRYY